MTQIWTASEQRGRVRMWVDALLVIAFGALFVVGAAPHVSAWGLFAAGVLTVAAVLRHHYPKMTLVLAWVGGLIQLTGKNQIVPVADLFLAPICFSFGASRDAVIRRLGLASAIAGSLSGGIIAWWYRSELSHLAFQVLTYIAAGGAVVLGGWVTGYLRWQNQQRLEDGVRTQFAALEQERLEESLRQSALREEIATEMHDVVGHSWAVVAAQADGARYLLRTNPEAAECALDVIAETARDAIGQLRGILRELRFSEGQQHLVGEADFDALIHRMQQAGMPLRYTREGSPPTPGIVTLTAHRVLTEMLTNAFKYGDLSRPVDVSLTWHHDNVVMTERNAIRTQGSSVGHGLPGMRHRVALVGGEFEAEARENYWHVHAVIPYTTV